MHREFIQKLTNLVEANLANETFGPDDLAREAGMSHTNLNRKLKTILNQNSSHFIREVRLKKAKELLLSGDLTVAEISYRVGFGSPAYFNRCFHEYFGVAPGEFKNHEQKNEPEEQPVKTLPKKSKRTKMLIGLFFGLIILIPLTVFLISKISKTTIKDKSIAVLPFENLSGEINNQYRTIGMMDAILSNLSKIKDLRVISRTSVEQYRDSKKPAKTIGKELDVGYLLEGSLQMYDNKVRLIVQLIRTKNENHVWSKIYDYEGKDIFSIQSKVAETVAIELQAAITPEEEQNIRKIPTNNLTAYDFYQRGRNELDIFDDSISLEKAQHLFQKALKLDSTFALAYSGLAEVYFHKHYWKTFFSENFLDSVLILANRALAFDNQCAEAYYYRGQVYFQTAKPEQAFREIDKAIKLNPNDWQSYNLRSIIFWREADFVGAISNNREALQRNRGKNLPQLLTQLGKLYLEAGFIDKARLYFQQSLHLTGDSTNYLDWLSWLELSNENFEEAYQLEKIVFKRDSLRVIVDFPSYCLMANHEKEAYYYFDKLVEHLKKTGKISLFASKEIGYSFWQEGRKQEAEHYFNQQIKIDLESIKLGRWNSIQKGAHFDLAEVYAFLGDKEKAYYYLDEVNKRNSFPLWWVTLFKQHPMFNPIRHEPRFQKILKDVEAKYQAEHERVKKWMVSQGLM